MEIDKIITLTGIFVSLIIGLTSMYIGVRNSKKTIFINSITSSRIKWMDTIRNTIAEYCSLTSLISILPTNEQTEKLIKLEQLRYLIKLQFHRDEKFDMLVINSLDSIYESSFKGDFTNTTKQINDLINITQDLLKLEWAGVKEETKKGNLSNREKKKLTRLHLKDYGYEN